MGSLLLLGAIQGCGSSSSEGDKAVAVDDGKYGSVLNEDEFKIQPVALPVEALTETLQPIQLPASVTLTNTPSVSMQGTPSALGSPGTCEAQSFAYGLGSYTAARNPDGSVKWGADLPSNQVSAAFQYQLNQQNGFAGPCPKGGLATTYLSRLAGFGSPSTSDVPYQPSCTYIDAIDVDTPYPDAPRLRIGSFAVFLLNAQSLPRIKAYLASGQAVAFSGPVYKGYSAPLLETGVFYDVVGEPDSRLGTRPVAHRLRRHRRLPRQQRCTARAERLRHELATDRVGLDRAAGQAVLVVRHVHQPAEARGGRVSVRSITTDRRRIGHQRAGGAARHGRAGVPVFTGR
jgi:hypothetical protein